MVLHALANHVFPLERQVIGQLRVARDENLPHHRLDVLGSRPTRCSSGIVASRARAGLSATLEKSFAPARWADCSAGAIPTAYSPQLAISPRSLETSRKNRAVFG
jgi:hypothetical protein